jgi:hypothetical protein
MGLGCGAGTDTIVLRRRSQAFGNWQAWYLFTPADFWDFWGGFNVTIDWFNDSSRGFWADQIPPPSYPIVPLPDLTLMVDGAGNFSLVVGGTAFAIDPNFVQFLGALGVSPSFAVPSRPLPPSPVDFTVVNELFRRSEMYVVFGGARFRIPDLAVLTSLGFSANQVRTLPPGGFTKLHKYPFDGTFLREQNSSTVYLAEKKKLRRATQAAMACISPRNVRVVPNNALASLSKGPDL